MFCVTAFGINTKNPHLRYIAKRIRKQVPNAMIVACCWDLDEAELKEANAIGDIDAVETSLKGVASACRRLARDGHPESPLLSAEVA